MKQEGFWTGLDGRHPWRWPPAWQVLTQVSAGMLGVALVSPWCLHSWVRWDEVRQAQAERQTQLAQTQVLQAQTAQMLQNHQSLPVALRAIKTPNDLRTYEGLQLASLVWNAPTQTPAQAALQVQQLPVQLQVQGAWQDWLHWLQQWPSQLPAMTVTELDLKANAQGVLAGRVRVSIPQDAETGVTDVTALDADPNAPRTHDPFHTPSWTQAQRRQAQQHPGYREWVAPELLRSPDALESFPRERLQYVGHIRAGAREEALVRVLPASADHKEPRMLMVHRVRVGSHLGQDLGRVLAVEPQALVVQEVVLTPTGVWQPREVHLPLVEGAP